VSGTRPSDVEVSRTLNALVTTLNDRKVEREEAATLQHIVTGAVGGEQHLRVQPSGTAVSAAAITDAAGTVLGRVRYANGRWVAERVGAPLSGAYIPRAA
jgi:hypothetical protein